MMAAFIATLVGSHLLGAINIREIAWLLIALGGTMLLGLIDDHRPLNWKAKLLFQMLCAWVACLNLPFQTLGGWAPIALPLSIAMLVAVINFVNFIDGIDEISVAHALPALAVPLLLVLLSGYNFQWGILSAALIGSLIGFWLWNRHPARIFLGDAGSLPLGLFLGWLALRLSMEVNPAIGLLILAYPLADAGSTLVRRALAGRTLTQPHRWHAYQQAVDKGLSPRFVALRVGLISSLSGLLAIMAAHTSNLIITAVIASVVTLAVGWQVLSWILRPSLPSLAPSSSEGVRRNAFNSSADNDPTRPG